MLKITTNVLHFVIRLSMIVTSLEWWAGSKSRTGNKTKSKVKKYSRRIYKKKARALAKQKLIKETT